MIHFRYENRNQNVRIPCIWNEVNNNCRDCPLYLYNFGMNHSRLLAHEFPACKLIIKRLYGSLDTISFCPLLFFVLHIFFLDVYRYLSFFYFFLNISTTVFHLWIQPRIPVRQSALNPTTNQPTICGF